MHIALKKLTDGVARFLLRYPRAGWAGWIIFYVIVLAGVHPRRFASTFTYYLEATERLLVLEQ
jgi:hypothetical protein